MTDNEEPDDAATRESDPDEQTGVPRWVRVFVIVGVIVIIGFIVLMVAGGGNHGPGRHLRSGDDTAPTSSFTGHPAPAGGHAP